MSSDSPSPSPSPANRSKLGDRPLSGTSLSSSTKQGTQKAHRHHGAGTKRSHKRTSSYGRALAKAGRTDSAQTLHEDAGRHHRTKSSTSIPSTSPRITAMKRNSSHVALAKNSSHVNLRKNKSANALARNLSHTQIHRKAGLGPSAPKPRKDNSGKQRGFQLGDKSSSDEIDGELEEEADWEDSATQSPKLTRSNSAVISQPSPPAPTTSERAAAEEAPRSPRAAPNHRTSSPPEPSLRHNRSAPNFGVRASSASPVRPPDPPVHLPLLPHNTRSSRAPPAISSISAKASRDPLPRNNSSFTHINHADTTSSQNTFLNTPNTANSLLNTPNTDKAVGGSSADGGVSHFLSSTRPIPKPNQQRRTSSGSDDDSPSSFLPNYHPQQSNSPEKVRLHGRIPSASNSNSTISTTKAKQHRYSSQLPSRTQQRLELQRRETMRAAAPTTATTPLLLADNHRGSSAVSLHSRSGSHGRSRGGNPTDPASAGAARLMIRQDYEAAERQLAVVRRFRNPVVEAVRRLKESGVLVLDKGMPTSASSSGLDGRERDRRKKAASSRGGLIGGRTAKSESNLKTVRGTRGDTETKPSIDDADADTRRPHSRPSSRGRSTRAPHTSAASTTIGTATSVGVTKPHPRRQGSHDDIGLSRSQGSYDAPDGENDGDGTGGAGMDGKGGAAESGLSAEMEMMRRMWESREIYDRGVH
jgi:hypothetical protein